METSGKRKIWMVLNHPQELATALALASYWGREKFTINLIIARHHYWSKVDINLYKHQFDEIFFFPRPDYVSSPFRGPLESIKKLRQMKKNAKLRGNKVNLVIIQSIFRRLQSVLMYPIRIVKMIREILQIKKQIVRLRIKPDDFIFGLSATAFVENIVISTHPQNLKVAVIPNEVYEQSITPPDRTRFKNTLEGVLTGGIIEPITGLQQTYFMRERERLGIGLGRYKKSLPEIYSRVIVLGNPSNNNERNITTMPFPYVLALNKTKIRSLSDKPQKVVLFGSNFLGMVANLMDVRTYVQKLNDYLEFIRDKYGSTFKLVYRPHPNETTEVSLLELKQFTIEHDGTLSELYLFQNMNNIYAAFSVESTSSRSALYFFINSYSFLNISPYDADMKEYFRKVYGDVPDDFYIKDLSVTPKRYIKDTDTSTAIKKCHNILDTLINK